MQCIVDSYDVLIELGDETGKSSSERKGAILSKMEISS